MREPPGPADQRGPLGIEGGVALGGGDEVGVGFRSARWRDLGMAGRCNTVMAGLGPAIHADPREKPRDDEQDFPNGFHD